MSASERPRSHYELRARIAKALAHPGRLMILDAIQETGEVSVAELTELLQVDQSTLSRHLKQLRDVGIVGARREGGLQRYSVRVTCLDGFWQCVEGVLAQQAADHEEALAPPGEAPPRVALVRVETLQPKRTTKTGRAKKKTSRKRGG